MDLIQIQNLCCLKDTVKLKRQNTECEKVSANHISDKELAPEYMKNSINSIIKNVNRQKIGTLSKNK